MRSGYNVYTLQQAARRSWGIGQKHPVKVIYLGYAETSQMHCLSLMAKTPPYRRGLPATYRIPAWMC
ncbi:hypothetical protein C8K18_13117 [Paraburkholderia sp. GV068]|jgi:hypothetical protein|nr:hypothetical protein C8K19_13012 [Paraburkholderia sp. GV072]PUA93640.1 hypothetical protein C8K18_13117 [Paraburkholderia sp. GV068]